MVESIHYDKSYSILNFTNSISDTNLDLKSTKLWWDFKKMDTFKTVVFWLNFQICCWGLHPIYSSPYEAMTYKAVVVCTTIWWVREAEEEVRKEIWIILFVVFGFELHRQTTDLFPRAVK